MTSQRKRLAAVGSLAAIAGALSMSAAAAAPSERPRATPSTVGVPCTSGAVWLDLHTALGQHCYSGDGTTPADLAGVSAERITGTHTVCLVFSSAGVTSVHCAKGPATIEFLPAVHVEEIEISH